MTDRLRRYRDDEQGAVLLIAALVLIPLLIVSAFAVDLGWFYVRGGRLQRAADAAALAGVMYMPGDPAKARAVACETLKKNDIPVPDADCVNVPSTMETSDYRIEIVGVAGKPRQLQVLVRDKRVPTFLAATVTKSVAIGKTATSEYVLSVPLGSPANYLGTGDLMASGTRENMWLAASGYCSSKENGDLLLAKTDANFPSSGFQCTGGSTETNTDYDPDGYFYAVDTGPTVSPAAMHIEVYDGSYGSSIDGSLGPGEDGNIQTTFRVTDTHGTPLDPSDDTFVDSHTYGTESSKYAKWDQIAVISQPTANNRYLVQVYTNASTANTRGSNSFGLRARVGGWSQCSTDPSSSLYSVTCPQVHGVENMGIYANFTSSQPSFYLASVGAQHAGKTMNISLFDPGEGASAIEVLDPNGSAVSFTWDTPCGNGIASADGGCSGGPTTKLNVGFQNQTQPGPNRSSSWRYNDRKLNLHVDLATNYTGTYGSKTWWKIRYTVASSPTDRTTWGVTISGDPVHLVTEN